MTDARGLAGPTTADVDVGSRPDEQVLNIETELLDDTKLSRAERARVLFQRARLSRLRGENDRARKDLEDAKPLADGRELLQRIDLEIRDLVNASDDADEIRWRLATPPVDGDAFACCRRGSDALVLGDIKLASQWYDEAEKHAVNGDEDTAALMGLSACVNWREDASRTTNLEKRRFAIPAVARPRSERVFERAEAARGSLLDRGREVAIHEYRKAIDEAHSMGWPRSARLSTVTLLDRYVESTIRLLLDDEASFDEGKEALALFIRHGRKIEPKVFTTQLVARFASNPGATEWLRKLLEARPASPQITRRSRELLCSAFIVMLDDATIVRHLREVFLQVVPRLEHLSAADTEVLYSHTELLMRDAWYLPSEIVTEVVEAATAALETGWLERSWDVSALPFSLWLRSGAITPEGKAIVALTESVSAFLETEKVFSNWHFRRALVRLAATLRASALLSSSTRKRIIAALEALLSRALESSGDNRQAVLLDVVTTLVEFEEWRPSPEVAIAMVDQCAEVCNSTAAQQWAFAIGRVAAECPASHVERLAEGIRVYARLALSDRGADSFLERKRWAAWMLADVAASRPDILPQEEAVKTILELASATPEAALSFSELGDRLALGPQRSKAEEIILAAWMRPNESAPDMLVRQWLEQAQPSSPPSEAVLNRAASSLVDSNPLQRMHAYYALRQLGEKRNLEAATADECLDAALRYGRRDPHCFVRAAATRALGTLGRARAEAVRAALADLTQDSIATVRRAAEIALAEMAN